MGGSLAVLGNNRILGANSYSYKAASASLCLNLSTILLFCLCTTPSICRRAEQLLAMDFTNAREANNPAVLVGIFVALVFRTEYLVKYTNANQRQFILYSAGNIIYTLYFHPLHGIPGPKINAISRIPYIRHMLGGTTKENVMELHKKYGEVVRVSPNEVSFISGETAWQEIYGFRVGQLKGQLNMQKDPVWYPVPINGAPSIIVSNDEAHSRGRRVLSHAFSEKALAEQEPLLNRFVDLLVDGLKDVAATTQGPQDMTDWYVSYGPP